MDWDRRPDTRDLRPRGDASGRWSWRVLCVPGWAVLGGLVAAATCCVAEPAVWDLEEPRQPASAATNPAALITVAVQARHRWSLGVRGG
jgi:hypothetical protein